MITCLVFRSRLLLSKSQERACSLEEEYRVQHPYTRSDTNCKVNQGIQHSGVLSPPNENPSPRWGKDLDEGFDSKSRGKKLKLWANDQRQSQDFKDGAQNIK